MTFDDVSLVHESAVRPCARAVIGDIMDINDPSVYTYYTIEPFEQQENDDDNIIYFTIGQNETTNEEDEPSSTGFEEMEALDDLSTYKVLSVEDGGLYVTETETDTELPMKQEIFCEESTMNYLENDESVLIEEQDSNDTEYQTIQLKDGRHAIIEKTLWSSLLQNNTHEDGSKKLKKFPCMYDGCDKVYTTAQHLTVHERIHTGDRPYECPIEGCDKAFAAGYSLKAHLRTHTGEKPYSCVACVKQFKTSGDLQKHIRTHTGEKPFKCPVEGCNRSFTTSNIRKVHIRSHTGERPYVCQIENCGKAFASATNYKNHTRIHSGEKPYVCPVADCNKRFTEYSSLYKHNTVHKPFKPYKCSYCGQLCKIESTLKAHKRTMHGVIFTQDGSEILVDNEDYPDVVFEISAAKSSLQLKE